MIFEREYMGIQFESDMAFTIDRSIKKSRNYQVFELRWHLRRGIMFNNDSV
jgi:hypothetical protein